MTRWGVKRGVAVGKQSEVVVCKPDGVVAQLVERLVRNEKVAGSIPVGSTIQKKRRAVRASGVSVRQGRGQVFDQAEPLIFLLLAARDVPRHGRRPDNPAACILDG